MLRVVLSLRRVIDGFGMLPYRVHRSPPYESIVVTAAERAQTEEFRSRTKHSESLFSVGSENGKISRMRDS